jgi:hypothetical protein
VREGCVVIGDGRDAVQPVWPYGTQVTAQYGALVINVPGQAGITVGQAVSLSGGFVSEPPLPPVQGRYCRRGLFYVSAVAR